MGKRIMDSFEDFHKQKLRDTRSKDSLILDDQPFTTRVRKVNIPESDNNYFLKTSDVPHTMATAASAKMYNNIGINTPPITILKPPFSLSSPELIQTIQPDVTQIPGIETVLANDDREYMQITRAIMGRDKWDIFYNYEVQARLLEIMTPECLAQIQEMFLIDELRTDIDRHALNFFLYKKKGSKLYEGVIVIDLEQMEIMSKCGTSKSDFQNFLYTPYYSVTPQHKKDYLCYIERAHHMREVIQDDVIPEKVRNTLEAALKSGMSNEIKNNCHKTGIYSGKQYKNSVVPMQRLEDYNINTIGKELGL